jgi:hypothetical protein
MAVPRDPHLRDKFTREHGEARRVAREFFAKYPKDRYQTEVESWRHLQSRNYEFTMNGCASLIRMSLHAPFRAADYSIDTVPARDVR